jgi:predicted N-acetyltransferase YhbS
VIARLAIDTPEQGRGLGAELLRDALRRLVGASAHLGIRAVVVDAIDDNAASSAR